MRRDPLQQFRDLVGMYAYLMALGGLRYWPSVRRSASDEQFQDEEWAEQTEASLLGASSHEFVPEREEVPVA